MTTIVIVIACLLVGAVVAWMLAGQRHPEQAATHRQPDRHRSDQPSGGVDRPAGPDTEGQYVAEPGSIAPAPPQDDLGDNHGRHP